MKSIKTWLFGEDETEEFEDQESDPSLTLNNSAQPILRLQTSSEKRVSVRRHAQGFDDARAAADGLKAGEQQIVNLEGATAHMVARILPFLNGVCYALDGTAERIGEKVYLFTPADISVDIDDGSNSDSRRDTEVS